VITRREFLATVGALTGVASVAASRSGGALPPTPAASRRLNRIGIELYTVRGLMRADMPGTLAAIAAIGYREVEFAGYFGRSNAEIKDLLAKNGLTSPSTHIGFDQMKVDWDKTFDDALEKGHKYIIVPSPPNGVAKTVDAWKRVAADFNRAGEQARKRKLGLGYHNHYTEFALLDGQQSAYDILLSDTDPRFVNLQLDVCWAVRGGADPRAMIRAHPKRFVMLHIKDLTAAPAYTQVDLGAGTIDFAGILREDRAVQHVYVEHDEPPDPMVFAKQAYEYLRKLEF
jgi:sugar phosphate isomerase/epimerase